MAAGAAEIDAMVAAGKITPLAGAMAKARFIGPQSLTDADRAQLAGQPMPSDSNATSAISTAAVLGAANSAAKPSGPNAAAAGALASVKKPAGSFDVTPTSTGLASKPKPDAVTSAASSAAKPKEAKPAAPAPAPKPKPKPQGPSASGKVAALAEDDNPWSNGEAAAATGEILDNTPGIGTITKPNYEKNYAGSAGVSSLGNPQAPLPALANPSPLAVGQPGQPMPVTGKPVGAPPSLATLYGEKPAAPVTTWLPPAATPPPVQGGELPPIVMDAAKAPGTTAQLDPKKKAAIDNLQIVRSGYAERLRSLEAKYMADRNAAVGEIAKLDDTIQKLGAA